MLFVFSFSADFTRPVVVVGGLADLVRMKLLKKMPDKFDLPSKYTKVCGPVLTSIFQEKPYP